MKNHLVPNKKGMNRISFKIKNILLIFLLVFSVMLVVPVKPVWAFSPGVIIVNTAKNVLDNASSLAKKLWKNAGAIAYHKALSLALDKIAYDAANYVGSAAAGQKPTFHLKAVGQYLLQVGDQASGQFIESFVNNMNKPETNDTCRASLQSCQQTCISAHGSPINSSGLGFLNTSPDVTPGLSSNSSAGSLDSCFKSCTASNTACESQSLQANANASTATPSFNVCGASSLQAKVKISLGLVNEQRPVAPSCSATKMVNNWQTDLNRKLADLRKPNYVSTLMGLFRPNSNDLGIYLSARTDMSSKDLLAKENAKTSFITNQGWLRIRNIGGEAVAPPGTSKRILQEAQAVRDQNFGKISTNVLVDAANIALNQLAMSLYNNLLRKVGSGHNNNNFAISNIRGSGSYTRDPNSGLGANALKQVTSKLLKPTFGTQIDYNILSSLAVCLNPQNPAPDNCVIDNQFMQAVTAKDTVAEAIKDGYLHGNWQITNNTSGSAYNSSYSLRNLMILAKYRILPIGWVEAAKLATDATNPHNATLNDLVSCFNSHDIYDKFSAGFDTANTIWCQGLVDPNWVLRSPLNYCKKKGFGAQILNKTVLAGTPAVNGIPATPSRLVITRADNYCADNQSCIKTRADGSCEAYGYCNAEKRTWNFSTDSCQPINNTCQSFTNPSGETVSYLQNTLNYGSCNSGNAGCSQYSLSGNYATSTGTVNWNTSRSLYLNNNLSTCSVQESGCTGLLRVQANQGDNLVMNSNFANDQIGVSTSGNQLDDWFLFGTSQSVIVDASQDPGNLSGKALKLSISKGSRGGVYSSFLHSLLPSNFQIIPGRAYTLSADVYITGGVNAGTSLNLTLGVVGSPYTQTMTNTNKWEHISVTRPANSSYNDPNFSISAQNKTNNGIFYVKNIKFEVGSQDTGYSSYGYTPAGSAKIYEKLLPPYLAKTCYTDISGANKNYTLKPDAPAFCSDYARKCNLAEVGCQAYTNVQDKFTVAAKTTTGDYCPAQCLGYDIYISQGSYFHSPTRENIIPKTAQACSAAAVGCTEFTNLDSLAQGGEQKEYYTSLKQCIKPSPTQCSTFYAWQGQTNGYQLQAYSLKNNGAGLPAVTSDDSALCNATIYNLPVSDPNFNSNCKQFYNASGQVAYHLVSRTITCSNDCHAYRMTDKNIDSSITQASACVGTNEHWNSVTNSCNVCLNGGVWDQTSGACIYQAIPGQGQTCSASQNGCSEYNGNTGSNVRLIYSDNFENGLDSWSSSCSDGTGISISSVSNNKNGHSLLYNAQACSNVRAQLNVSGLITTAKAYTLKFVARAANNTSLKIYFINLNTGIASSAWSPVIIKGGNTWNVYQTNLANLDKTVGNKEELVISANGNFYLGNFILSEIADRYYLIKGSSQIPNVCYYDTAGNYQGVDYNLGCAQYTSSSGVVSNLHQFNSLCSASSVGCEQVINTNNYSSPGPGFWENGVATSTCSTSDPNCVIVPGDQSLYAIYDTTKQCSAPSQGCSLLGQGQGGANLTGWSDVFKLNNPDNYSKTLCSAVNVGCEAYQGSNNTISYFKNPGNKVCIYRASQNPTISQKSWYKVPVKRCDLNNDGVIDNPVGGSKEIGSKICLNNSDCGSSKCIVDNNDYLCNYSVFKTIGLGGQGSEVKVPSSDVGLCSARASGCTEYIDPVTRFNPNLVNNANFVITNGIAEGWGRSSIGTWSPAPTPTQQVISLEPYKLYSLDVSSGDGSGVSLSFSTPIRPLLNNNNFGSGISQLIASSTANTPIIFDSAVNRSALLSGGNPNRTISIKELAVNYQLQQNIDKTSCNGQAQFNNGCILFNERSVTDASGPASLNFNAYAGNSYTTNPYTPITCSPGGSCNANQVIKVSPSRVCSQWLSCTSYIQDPVTHQKTCYSFGECNSLNSKNGCANFVNTATSTVSAAVNSNATGYSILNDYNLSQMKIVGEGVATAHYDFENSSIKACSQDNLTQPCLIDSPDTASLSIATSYPAQGKAYLAIPAGKEYTFKNKSAVSNSKPTDYYISYLVNTSKSAGLRAKIIITPYYGPSDSATMGTPIVIYSPANLAWTREVNKFTLTNANKITITLSSDASTSAGGPVYFDNINISPVLQVAPNKYVAPECRLYPTSGSLSCISKDSNTIKPGLEGYCLEHDPANTNVCLLWYPLDNIPSLSLSSSGYAGKFPLNYCAEANGNFVLLEKRLVYVASSTSIHNHTVKLCGKKYKDGAAITLSGTTHTTCDSYSSCDQCPADYNTDISWKFTAAGASPLRIICLPKKNKLFNHFQTSFTLNNASTFGQCNGITTTNGYGIYNGLQGAEATNMNPPIAVYNYNNPPASAAQLKFPYATSTSSNDVFNIACNTFVQAVDNQGLNKAWVLRVNTVANTTPTFFSPYNGIPNYSQNRKDVPFGAASSPKNNLFNSGNIALNNSDTKIGSNIAGRPYGCNNGQSGDGCDLIGSCTKAPDTYCLTTKNDNFSNTGVDGKAIDYSLASSTCGRSGGSCVPLWSSTVGYGQLINTASAASSPYEKILKNIFLSGNIYKYNSNNGGNYSPAGFYDFSNVSNSDNVIPQCNSNIRSDPNTFCAVYPSLFNVKLYYNNSTKALNGNNNISYTDSLQVVRGWYRLEFNSKIDPQQRPLTSIVINWGDGYIQTIYGQNARPVASSPQVVYHHYSQNATIKLKVEIIDNWGFFAHN